MKRPFAVAVLLMVGGIGCDSGAGPAGGFSTTIAGDRPISGLSGEEVTTLCTDVRAYVGSPAHRSDDCEVVGITLLVNVAADPTVTDAELRASCTDLHDACVMGSGFAGFCDNPGASLANCSATVAEFDSCVEAVVAQRSRLAAVTPDCAAITRAALADPALLEMVNAITSEPLVACDVYQSKCVP